MKKCEICNSELFMDEKNELFCPECETSSFLTTFDEEDDSWMGQNFKIVKPKTKSVTIRLYISDIEKAKSVAKDKNIPYQALIKDILHKNLATS